MIRIVFVLACALALPAQVAAQRPGGPPLRNQQGAPQQRALLERQIIRRFVEQTGQEMALDAPARSRLEQILQDSNNRRRALVVASLDLRQRLAAAIRDPATEDARFQRLLSEAEALRRQEHELWQRDQMEIGRTLTPRQQAIFALRWIRFQERIQQMIGTRDGRGGPPRDSGF